MTQNPDGTPVAQSAAPGRWLDRQSSQAPPSRQIMRGPPICGSDVAPGILINLRNGRQKFRLLSRLLLVLPVRSCIGIFCAPSGMVVRPLFFATRAAAAGIHDKQQKSVTTHSADPLGLSGNNRFEIRARWVVSTRLFPFFDSLVPGRARRRGPAARCPTPWAPPWSFVLSLGLRG